MAFILIIEGICLLNLTTKYLVNKIKTTLIDNTIINNLFQW